MRVLRWALGLVLLLLAARSAPALARDPRRAGAARAGDRPRRAGAAGRPRRGRPRRHPAVLEDERLPARRRDPGLRAVGARDRDAPGLAGVRDRERGGLRRCAAGALPRAALEQRHGRQLDRGAEGRLATLPARGRRLRGRARRGGNPLPLLGLVHGRAAARALHRAPDVPAAPDARASSWKTARTRRRASCRSRSRTKTSGTASSGARGSQAFACSRASTRRATRRARSSATSRWAITRSCGATASGRGRAFYSALGHGAETYARPEHARMLEGAIAWAAGLEGDCR